MKPWKLTTMSPGRATVVARDTGVTLGDVQGARQRFSFPERVRVSVAGWYGHLVGSDQEGGPFQSRVQAASWVYRQAEATGLLALTSPRHQVRPVASILEEAKAAAARDHWFPVVDTDHLTRAEVLRQARGLCNHTLTHCRLHRGAGNDRRAQILDGFCFMLGAEPQTVSGAPAGLFWAGQAVMAARFLGPRCDPPGEVLRMARGIPCVPDCDEGCLS